MSRAVTAILYAPGTNCHEETAAALAQAGLASRLVLLHDLIEAKMRLSDYQALIIPGGFSYGDHLGAGRIFATALIARLGDALTEFLEDGKPILGICNGFQVLAETGVLPRQRLCSRAMALLRNQSARFEDRKIHLLACEPESLWTRGLAGQILEMPSAHGEGRPLFSESVSCRIALKYANASGAPATSYPENPNGAPDAMAGVSSEKGLVLGLMPHPERASLPVHYSQHGLKLFKNLARWLSS
ncbi:MAG: phosphoribosylformylglycinamidine synthase I [Terriglobia bacterium]